MGSDEADSAGYVYKYGLLLFPCKWQKVRIIIIVIIIIITLLMDQNLYHLWCQNMYQIFFVFSLLLKLKTKHFLKYESSFEI